MAVLPPDVIQATTEQCWAACMESWTSVAWYWTKVDQGRLALYYADNPNGGLCSGGPKYKSFLLNYSLTETIVAAGALTEAMAQQWLTNGGYFMLILQKAQDASHAMLAFGCSGGYLPVMDPARGYTGGPVNGSPEKLLILHF
jgi:hypothetical protein